MKKVYAIMAFTFAALISMSLWVGLNDMGVTRNLTADDSNSATSGQGR
ncbi:hypothetical protein [Bradyrhizobium jicamae]|nr:hypothetical protein [Bradyrhizobium jicamae]